MDDHQDRYEVTGMSDPVAPATAPPPSASLPRAIAGGLAAAVVGGVVWALIVKTTDYEVGFVAWGIGFAVGTAVVLATGGAKGRPLQIVAVVLALVGVLIGKYLSYAFIVQEEAESFGESIGLFSGDMFRFFREDLDAVFGLFDLLWVGLAVFSAWRIAQVDEEEELPSQPQRELE
jgi:mannose/fructose/N-acetylgalactosamine-specific phosphotransferase system component IID